MALPLDPLDPSASPERSTDFVPLDLAPGEEGTIVVRWVAGACADPDGPKHPEPAEPSVFVEYGASSVAIVYEALGWRRQAPIVLPFGIAVPARPDCIDWL